jgi:hypothetical protein
LNIASNVILLRSIPNEVSIVLILMASVPGRL